MLIRLIESQFDHAGTPYEVSFADLVTMLSSYRRTECEPHPAYDAQSPNKCSHRAGPAWVPVELVEDGRVNNAGVAALTVFVADIDHITKAELVMLVSRLRASGSEFFLGSTHSHDPERDDWCMRLVMPMNRAVPRTEILRFRASVCAALGIPADKRTRDVCHLYYLPSAPTRGPEPRLGHVAGVPLDVDAMLVNAPDIQVPEERQALPTPAPSEFPSEDERQAAVSRLHEAMAGTRNDDSRAAMRLVLAGEDVLGPGGGRHDSELNRVARILAGIAANVDLRLSTDDLLALMRPALARCVCGKSEHQGSALEAAAWTKLDRHLKTFRGVVIAEREKAEREKAALDAAFRPEDPPPSGGVPVPTNAPAAEDPNTEWQRIAILKKDKYGNPVEGQLANDPANAHLLLKLHQEWRGRFRLNLLTQMVELDGRSLTDPDVTAARNWMARNYQVELSTGVVFEQMMLVAKGNAYEPVQEYLDRLAWDSTPRVETWLHDLFGVAYLNEKGNDIELYVRAVSKRTLVSMVARAYEPGCKVDTVLILEGEQGMKKSTAFQVLGGAWFSDDAGNVLGDKDTKQGIASVWIQEMPELTGMARSDVEAVKAFMSRRVDRYRPSYGRSVIERPRRCVFVGSTNDAQYLKDQTGNRRFWPVKCARVCDIESLAEQRDQLWAEAVVMYRAGEQYFLTDAEEALAKAETQERTEQDGAWTESALDWWEKAGRPNGFTVKEMLTAAPFHYTAGQIKRGDTLRAGEALRQAGFESCWVTRSGKSCRGYRPGSTLAASPSIVLKVVPPAQEG